MKKIVQLLLVLSLICTACTTPFAAAAGDDDTYGYGYVDMNGDIVIPYQFDYAYPFVHGRARVFSGKLSNYGSPSEGVYGYIDETGKTVIPLRYDNAENFNQEGYAIVAKNGKYGLIDTDGNVVLDFAYDYLGYYEKNKTYKAFNGTLTDYGYPDTGTTYVIRADDTVIFSGEYDGVYGYDGYYEAKKNGKYGLIDADGTVLTAYQYDSLSAETATSLAYKEGSLYGYMDKHGNRLTEPLFDSAGSFVDGKAIVKKNSKYYLIDETGNTLVSYQADYVSMSIVNGRTYAYDGTLSSWGSPTSGSGKMYLIDLDGNMLSRAYAYDDAYGIDSNGNWRIKSNGKWYLVDMDGNEISAAIDADYIYPCGEANYFLKRNCMYALADAKGNAITDFLWDDYTGIPQEAPYLLPVLHQELVPDFRSVRWGMTEAEVKALEGSSPKYSGKLDGRNGWYIGYDTTLMGNDVILAFYFGSNGLYEARYIWTESHSNDNLYISDYSSVRTELTKKYGSPWWDYEDWDTTSHKSYYADRKGEALSFGYLSYETCYRTPRTDITMQMSADNYDVSFIIYYESKTVTAPTVDYSNQF